MKLNKENTWVYILTGLSVLLSVAAITISIPREHKLDFDYQGVIVGIFSLLVTFLVGWNVFSVINIKESKEENKLLVKKATDECAEAKKLFDSLDSKINLNSYDNLQNTIDILEASGFIGNFGNGTSPAAVLRVYCRLLVVHHNLNNSSEYFETLNGIYDYYKNNKDNLVLSKDDANSILSILFPIAKSEANVSMFSEVYNWLSSFLMK